MKSLFKIKIISFFIVCLSSPLSYGANRDKTYEKFQEDRPTFVTMDIHSLFIQATEEDKNKSAQYWLARKYLYRKNYAEAYRWLYKAAIPSPNLLGNRSYKSYERASHWALHWFKLETNGNRDAQYWLAQYLLQPKSLYGVFKYGFTKQERMNMGIHILIELNHKDDARAALYLARLYEKGMGEDIIIDADRAKYWYQRAEKIQERRGGTSN